MTMNILKGVLENPLPDAVKPEDFAEGGPLDLFHFVSRGRVERKLRVAIFKGTERVNDTFDFDLEVVAPHDIDPLNTLEDSILGHPGSLVLMGEDQPRVIHGVVTGYEVLRAIDLLSVRLRLRLSPRLSLLNLRVHSRIFQELTVPAIVGQILSEFRVPHRFELSARYAVKTYVTQYHESDYEFLTRILAREGIFFYFRHAPDKEVEEVVFTDEAQYRPVHGRTQRLQVRTGRFEIGEGEIVEVGVRRRIRQTSARIGNFDFRHPHLPLRSIEMQPDAKGAVGDLGTERLGTYLFDHDAEHEPAASADKRDRDATRLLESLRGDGLAILGSTRSRKLMPGHSFVMEGHILESLNREWVVTSITHDGITPELGGGARDEVYKNEVEAAPVETALRMEPHTRRRVIHGTQTATVVGGAEGEVFTDSYGRVKVQFHWDLQGKKDEKSSTWIRVSQPWAGPSFGAQFLPRVGTEVVVSFLDGDPDRPLIIGAVFNGTHPYPFGLPQSATKSGFRSLSTPGGDGASEFSFEDEKGRELVTLKAQRNFALDVTKDQKVDVGGDATLRVRGQLTENVEGTHTTTVAGGQVTLVTLQKTTQVLGDSLEAVRGNLDARVSGDRNVRVEGAARDDLESHESFVRTDAIHRVKGHFAGIVGEQGATTSASVHVEGTVAAYASRTTEIIAEKGIVLRCGQSSIRLGPDSVEIIAPRVLLSGDKVEAGAEEELRVVSKKGLVLKSEKLHAMGKSASLLLFTDADIGGQRVKLNSKVDEAAIVAKPRPLTKISLTDEDGSPAARRRFVIVGSDGERSGVLNDRGVAELELEADAQIYFPDVDKPKEA
jgi:type VI secretion system secreted protein VgrG